MNPYAPPKASRHTNERPGPDQHSANQIRWRLASRVFLVHLGCMAAFTVYVAAALANSPEGAYAWAIPAILDFPSTLLILPVDYCFGPSLQRYFGFTLYYTVVHGSLFALIGGLQYATIAYWLAVPAEKR